MIRIFCPFVSSKLPGPIFSQNKMRTNRLGSEASTGYSGKNFICKSFGDKTILPWLWTNTEMRYQKERWTKNKAEKNIQGSCMEGWKESRQNGKSRKWNKIKGHLHWKFWVLIFLNVFLLASFCVFFFKL